MVIFGIKKSSFLDYIYSMNLFSTDTQAIKNMLTRFIRYVKIWSESNSENADKGIFPSTQRQYDFAEILKNELIDLGLKEVQVTKDCYVYGFLPASEGMETLPSSLLMAHLDTVDEVSGKDVNPQVFENYDGKDICLAENLILSAANDKYLAMAAAGRETIITTDGTTLLGGDDKAGITAIMSAISFLQENKSLKHRAVEVMFSPDEETGNGMDKVPLEILKSKHAYTVDGGHIGELETECFNAWSAEIKFTGKATHTGNAKENKMINAAVMASSFTASLPRHKAPETTEKFEGFIAPMKVSGTIESAEVELLLRSFTKDEIEEEKIIVENTARMIEKSFGGKVEVKFTQQYLNMKEKMLEHPEVVEQLEKAFKSAGVEIINSPIRGGTDGSRLTEMGIPTPNIFTGAHNFHSRSEWCSLNQMAKASDILINLLMK